MLGDRLRELRQHHGLSLRQLAAAADVSPALLSQIENGATNPSLTTLRKLAGVFDESIASLFTEPDAPAVHVSRPGRRNRLSAPAGQVSYERHTPGRGELEVLEALMQPGEASSIEPRGHPSTECALVIDGTVTAEVDGARYEVVAGESITFDSRLPHRYVNDTDRTVRLVIAVTPPTP
ncbi:helix-turn-helix domain-containing protein [Jiangella sp. DSM 45060]|uniref:helix-turn-helix domain-containing protein n=1 Tax=Jiangella sp. DSM 45060 TaxID=1798224 RepID=UPI00087A699D|nr:helix-turn-helix domain-containing protein [Jiangella sp. DSM 45060]SDT29077.1 Cupin domain-containing protein [Jiangella sp. DSM 45060]